jgi:exodeoxyribonuclease-3
MQIATWNINGLRARLEFLLAWLDERRPDVVGLQELKLEDGKFPHDAFLDLGYHALCHGQKAWNGVAILSREEPREIQRGLPGQEDFGARLLSAEVGGLHFATLYCPNGKNLDHADYDRKLAFFDALRSHVEEHHPPESASILCGDFNICPSPLDSWRGQAADGEIFHTRAERERMRALYASGHFDLYRELHPADQVFSWWDYRGGAFHRGRGLRIDFILGTQAIRDRIEEVSVDRDWRKKRQELTASDHAPVLARLR